MPPQVVSSEILSPLTDISGANTLLLLETFHDLGDEKDLPGLLEQVIEMTGKLWI